MSVNVHKTTDGRLMVAEGPSRREDQAYDVETGKPVEIDVSASSDCPGEFCVTLAGRKYRVTPEWLDDKALRFWEAVHRG